MSNKTLKKVTRDKEGYYILIKVSLHEEDKTIINIYTPNNRAPKYMKQKLREPKGKIESYTKMIGNFNTPLLIMDRITQWKISREL